MKSSYFTLIIFLTLAVLFLLPQTAFCLPDPGGDCDPLDPLCPIDGGVAILVALGAGIGVLRKKQN